MLFLCHVHVVTTPGASTLSLHPLPSKKIFLVAAGYFFGNQALEQLPGIQAYDNFYSNQGISITFLSVLEKYFSKIAVVLFCVNVSNVDLFKFFHIDFGMVFLLLLVVFLFGLT